LSRRHLLPLPPHGASSPPAATRAHGPRRSIKHPTKNRCNASGI